MASEHCICTKSYAIKLEFLHFRDLALSLEYWLILSWLFHLVKGYEHILFGLNS